MRFSSILSFICILIFSAFHGNAQDIIFMKNGEEIKAKVLEVNSTNVLYKKTSNLDGPVYSESKTEIFFIKYASGVKEVISTLETTAPNNQQVYSAPPIYYGIAPFYPQKIEVNDGHYYQFGLKLSKVRLYEIFGNFPDERIRVTGQQAVKNSVHAIPLIILSIPMITSGLLIAVLSSQSNSSSGLPYGYAPEIIGFSIAGIGTGTLILGANLKSKTDKKVQQAVEAYNQKLN
jgi:hypothetical protein